MLSHMPPSQRFVLTDALVVWFDKMIKEKIDNEDITEGLINMFASELENLTLDDLEALYNENII